MDNNDVYATAMEASGGFNDIVSVTLSYQNGSIGMVSYFANGDKSLPNERVEIHQAGVTAVLDDFRALSIHARGKGKEKRLFAQDKGQKTEVRRFLDAVLRGDKPVIPYEDIYSASVVSFKILQSIQSGMVLIS